MKTFFVRPLLVVGTLAMALNAFANQGTFIFNGNLNAQQGGVNAMTATNPQSQNFYSTAFLYGATRTTYNTVGMAGSGNNAGLSLNASTLVATNNYTLEMVVSLSVGGAYKKLADVSGRTLDSGYYIDPSNHLNAYPVASGTTVVNPGTYNYLALSVASTGDVKGYVNGNLEFTSNTTVMNGNVFDFFLDDSATSFNEYSNVSVGMIRLTDSVLSDASIASLAGNPYAGTVPEPTGLSVLAIGLFGTFVRRRSLKVK